MASRAKRQVGKYELLKKIGSGGMAEIYLARQAGIEGFEKLLVLKRIHPSLSQGTEATRFETMFLDEARLAARLNHPNIVQIYDLGRADDQLYIAMEYVNGVDLSRLITRLRCRDQRVPIAHAVKIMTYLCEALTYAHSLREEAGAPLGLVHRDVSPQNVLLSFDGGIKLTDFGIAKATARTSQTRAGKVKGKMSYMSPEQVRGKDLDQRSDLFNVGILLYELTTGERPFGGHGHQQIFESIAYSAPVAPVLLVPDYPPDLIPILEKALAKNPDDRFQDALALQLALEQFMVTAGLVSNATVIGNFVRDLFDEVVQAQYTGHEGSRSISLEGILSSREIVLQLEEATEDRLTPSERPPAARGEPVDVTAEREPVPADAVPTAPEVPRPGVAATVPDGDVDVHTAPTAPDMHGAPTTPEARHPSFMLDRVSASALPAVDGPGSSARPREDAAPTENLAVTRPERPLREPSSPARGTGSRALLLLGAVVVIAAAALAIALLLRRADGSAGRADPGGGAAPLELASSDAGAVIVARSAADAGASAAAAQRDAAHEAARGDRRAPRGDDDDDAPPPPPPPADMLEVPPELEAWLQGEDQGTREIGRLTLRTVPVAEVWLGYNHLGETPIKSMKLPVGRFPLRLRSRAGVEKSIVVEIKAGEVTELQLDLRR